MQTANRSWAAEQEGVRDLTALAGESERTRGTVGAGKKVNKNGTKMKEADG